jgi:hypothetical protein
MPSSPRPDSTTSLPPSRLQHSPSLPNIWSVLHPFSSFSAQLFHRLPPHSRPPIMSAVSPSPQHKSDPSTPAAPQKPASKSPEGAPLPTSDKVSLKANDTRHISIKASPLPARRRQRNDREQSQHLLTPPLTPSSSIRTAASADPADGRPEDRILVLQEQHEPEATRFLHVSKIILSSPKFLRADGFDR